MEAALGCGFLQDERLGQCRDEARGRVFATRPLARTAGDKKRQGQRSGEYRERGRVVWTQTASFALGLIGLTLWRSAVKPSASEEFISCNAGFARRSGTLCFDHPCSLLSVAARRRMVCPTASRPMRVTTP